MGQGWWEVGDFGRYGVLSLAEGTDCCIHLHWLCLNRRRHDWSFVGIRNCVHVDVLCRNTDVRWSLRVCWCTQEHRCVVVTVCWCFVQERRCVVSLFVLLFCAGTQMCGGHCVLMFCAQCVLMFCAGTQICGGHSVCWCFVQEHRCVVVTVCVNVLCTVCVDVLCRSTAVRWSQRVTWSRHAVSSQLSPAATSSAFSEQISRSEFTETLGQRFIGYRVRPKVAG